MTSEVLDVCNHHMPGTSPLNNFNRSSSLALPVINSEILCKNLLLEYNKRQQRESFYSQMVDLVDKNAEYTLASLIYAENSLRNLGNTIGRNGSLRIVPSPPIRLAMLISK